MIENWAELLLGSQLSLVTSNIEKEFYELHTNFEWDIIVYKHSSKVRNLNTFLKVVSHAQMNLKNFIVL